MAPSRLLPSCVVPGPGALKFCWHSRKLWGSIPALYWEGCLFPVLMLRAVHGLIDTPHDTVTNTSVTVSFMSLPLI